MTTTAHATTPPYPGTPELHPHGLPRPGPDAGHGCRERHPDSFSDGGLSFAADAAVAHGLTLLEQGADIVDVGGESTRPGTARPPVEECG
ncbi:dihydropteroate synthase [Streptomyces sp. NPDC059679]|uniref:dihydropteroate synthase n=1 Tax=Streptomyces sp. NPDC059679 TaxID=3346903 RepID=UPI0036CDA1CC